ncbi:MAG: 1-acyl-sn-glycerol-3-phosphate acyltransferase [Candidatus Azobacteroides sp.]|nr:1-acyl-sn-glycerol-3-phosphate acyltransferase [Candidatus Azobacteroides sp.]
MKRLLFLIYQIFIWLPVFLVATILTALIASIGCMCGGEKIFSYYPGMIWSRLTCIISLCPVKVTGRELIDHKKSYVFIANHQGAYDIFLIYGYLRQPIKWIMKQSLRKIPFVGYACEKCGFIFVDNSSPQAAAKAIKEAEKRLKNGASVFLFPEGSRTKTGGLGNFKKGAYQMAMNLNLPIVPVTINGSFQIMSKDTFLFTPHKMEMIIHEPIETTEYKSNDIREAATNMRVLVDKTREIIAKDLKPVF